MATKSTARGAAEAGPAPGSSTTVRYELRVFKSRVKLEAVVPAGPARPRQLLPVLRELSAVLVEGGAREARAAGQEISCKAGCAACCRQLVPVSEPEARRLREVIKALPEARRQALLARFEAAQQQLEGAGVLAELTGWERLSESAFAKVAMRYLHADVACPFLEDERCSVYSERPLVCREYLVTSAPQRCSALAQDAQVDRLPLPGEVSRALGMVQRLQEGAAARPPAEAPLGRGPVAWVPLVLAPTWAGARRDQAVPRPGPELLRAVVDRLSK